MVVASEIPIDICAHIVHPKHHIPLSQICQTSRAVYDGEDRWKHLCRSIGVGRGSVECREPWKKVFIEVVNHRERCKAPLCYQFGVPSMRSVGDLLTTPEALKDHFQYFREDNKCNCGRRHDCEIPSSDEESGELEDEDDEHEDTEDDEGSDDDEDEDEDEWSDEPEEVAEAFDDAAMASFFNYLGVPPPPGLGHSNISHPVNGIPIPGYGNPNGAPGYHPLANTPLGAAPTSIGDMINTLFPGMGLNDPGPPSSPPKSNKEPKMPKSEVVPKSKLLPLSLKNLADVPPRPILHPLLADTGSIQFQRFLDGKMALHPCTSGPNLTGMATSTMTGMDWDEGEDGSDDEKDPNIEDIEEHALIARAFATNPPVVDLKIMIDVLETKVYNSDGVTVKDVIHKLNRFLRKPLDTKEKLVICGPPHPGCNLDTYSSRLAYLIREYPLCSPESKLEGVKQCWLNGVVDVRAWCAVCVLCPTVPPPPPP